MFEAVRLEPQHFAMLDVQSSQHLQLGLDARVSDEEALELCNHDDGWATFWHGRLTALCGIRELFPNAVGCCWALLARDVGAGAHLALTRFVRSRIAASALPRIEAVTRCGDAEILIGDHPGIESFRNVLIDALVRSSPETIWAALVGLTPVHVLRKFGAASETHMLFERIN